MKSRQQIAHCWSVTTGWCVTNDRLKASSETNTMYNYIHLMVTKHIIHHLEQGRQCHLDSGPTYRRTSKLKTINIYWNIIWKNIRDMKCLCIFFLLSEFIKGARLNPRAGWFWPEGRMFGTPVLEWLANVITHRLW